MKEVDLQAAAPNPPRFSFLGKSNFGLLLAKKMLLFYIMIRSQQDISQEDLQQELAMLLKELMALIELKHPN